MVTARRPVRLPIAFGRRAVVAALVASLAGGCVLPGRAAPAAYAVDGALILSGAWWLGFDQASGLDLEVAGWCELTAGVAGAVITTLVLLDGDRAGERDAALRVEAQRLDRDLRAAARAGRCLDAARRYDQLWRLDRGYAAEVQADDRAVAGCLAPTVGPGAPARGGPAGGAALPRDHLIVD